MRGRIVPMTEEHLDGCARLLVSAFGAEPWNEKWTLETARNDVLQTLGVPGYLGFVCLADGVVGMAAGHREQDAENVVFYLAVLCVSPEFQREGVGGELMRRLERELSEMGIRSVYLLTERGTPAHSFYEKAGYEVSEKDILMFREW